MNKAYRHGQILKLLRAKHISTQQELADELLALGLETTQVTLSRDMRELSLVKTQAGYKPMQGDLARPELASVIREYLLDARAAQNLLVLRTPPANASPLAKALDESGWPEIVGTVAGDDTVLVVAPDASTAERVRKRLLELAK